MRIFLSWPSLFRRRFYCVWRMITFQEVSEEVRSGDSIYGVIINWAKAIVVVMLLYWINYIKSVIKLDNSIMLGNRVKCWFSYCILYYEVKWLWHCAGRECASWRLPNPLVITEVTDPESYGHEHRGLWFSCVKNVFPETF